MASVPEPGVVLIVCGAVLAWCAGGCRHQPAAAPPPPMVTVAHPIRQEVTDYAEHTGTARAVETVDVRARVQGWLQSMHYTPDATVARGDLLFVIEPNQYQASLDAAKAGLAQAQAALEFAQFDFQRLEKLFQEGAAAAFEYNQAIASLDQAKATVLAAEANVEQAQLNLNYTQVSAPIAGRVGRNLVDIGNLVGAASQPTVLATMVNDRQVYVYFTASEAEYLRYARTFGSLKRGGPATQPPSRQRPVYLGLSDEDGYPHEGRLDYTGVRIDPATGTLTLRAIFDDPHGVLLSGLFARVRVPLDTREELLVPDVALQADQSGPFVLLVDPRDIVEHRTVRTGRIVDRMRVIEEGLVLSDRVIVNGIQRARPGNPVRVTQAPGPSAMTAPTSRPRSQPGPGGDGDPARRR